MAHRAIASLLVLDDDSRVNAERLGICQHVQVVPNAAVEVIERVDLPLLAGEPRQHATLDVRQVGDHQLLARLGHEAASHGAGAEFGHVVDQQILAVQLHRGNAGLDVLGLEERPRQVLRLEQAPGVAAGARGAAELDDAAQASVAAGGVDDDAIFGRRRGGRLLPYLQQLARLRVQALALQDAGDRGLGQVFDVELHDLVEVLQQLGALRQAADSAARQMSATNGQRSRSSLESSESSVGERYVNGDTTVINSLVDPP